jgi:hypothetical protein
MSDDFGLADFENYLNNLRSTIDNIVNENLEAKANSSIDTIARAALRELLVEIGMAAFYSVEEYAGNSALADRFEAMLSKPQHVSIHGGKVESAFDEKAAGASYLLFTVPGQHTMTNTAPAVWKYGIYGPAHNGPSFPEKVLGRLRDHGIPEYDEVIDERLAYWDNNTAPFWILIDKGTAAFGEGARAYPQFSGRNFVDEFRRAATRVVGRARELYMTNFAKSLGAEVEELIKEPRRGATITIARIPVGEKSISVQVSSAGNVFYRIGRTGISFEEAKAAIKRAYR